MMLVIAKLIQKTDIAILCRHFQGTVTDLWIHIIRPVCCIPEQVKKKHYITFYANLRG